MRLLRRLLAAVLVLALLGGGAELALRLIIPGIIESTVRDQLQLSADHPVRASLGGSALLHAVTGRIGDVTIEIDGLPLLDGVAVDTELHADSVPFDPSSGEMRGGTGALTVPPEQLDGVVRLVTSGVADAGEVSNGELTVGRTVNIFGVDMPVTLALQLGIEGGDVTVTPAGLSAGGLDVDADQLGEAAGAVLGPLLTTHTVCVADQMPRGIHLTGIELSSTGSATLRADLAPGLLSDPAELEPGTCG